MPDGKRAEMQGLGQFTMGPYVVGSITANRFRVYSAATGNLIGTYP
jgi:hypothetical protein